MMRLWASSYAKTMPVMTSATLSVVAHAVVIGAWVVATLPPAEMPSDSFANRTYPHYQPPPDRTPGQAGTRETVHYIDLASREGVGAGDGGRKMGDEAPGTLSKVV